MKLINPHDLHRAPLSEDSRAREFESTKDVPEYDIEEPPEPVDIPIVKPEKIDQSTESRDEESDGNTRYSKRADSAIARDAESLKSRKANKKTVRKTCGQNIQLQNWLIGLLLVFALSVVGLGVSLFAGSFIPLWLMFGFSTIYSIEKWLYYFTRKSKGIGKLYRSLLNLSILSLLGILVWTGIRLFSQQFVQSTLMGSLIFIAEFVLFILMWKVVAKNSWRWPSMKLTVFSLLCLVVVFAFAGVQPTATYKDETIEKVTIFFGEQKEKADEKLAKAKSEEKDRIRQQEIDREDREVEQKIIDEQNKIKEAELSGLIHNGVILNNPTWSELKKFLFEDDTDEIEYVYPTMVCADFANRLQRNAKEAGWRCAIVSIESTGYDDPFGFGIASDAGHACNAFETTDRGLVYIDSTGWVSGIGPLPADRLAKLEIGKRQINTFIFLSDGWINKDNVSVTKSIDIRW